MKTIEDVVGRAGTLVSLVDGPGSLNFGAESTTVGIVARLAWRYAREDNRDYPPEELPALMAFTKHYLQTDLVKLQSYLPRLAQSGGNSPYQLYLREAVANAEAALTVRAPLPPQPLAEAMLKNLQLILETRAERSRLSFDGGWHAYANAARPLLDVLVTVTQGAEIPFKAVRAGQAITQAHFQSVRQSGAYIGPAAEYHAALIFDSDLLGPACAALKQQAEARLAALPERPAITQEQLDGLKEGVHAMFGTLLAEAKQAQGLPPSAALPDSPAANQALAEFTQQIGPRLPSGPGASTKPGPKGLA